MRWWHWVWLALIFLAGYVIGKKFTIPYVPSFGGGGSAGRGSPGGM
jgi:hypothetical protein